MILVITDALDVTANAVVACLNKEGVRWSRFNQAEFPERVDVEFYPGKWGANLIFDEYGDPIDLATITSTWIWHPMPFNTVTGLDGAQSRFISEACRSCSRFAMELLRKNTFMVTHPAVETRANDKGWQLRTASTLGFRIPETLSTNSPQKAREFCSAYPQVVFKTLNMPRIDTGDHAGWIPTNLLDPEDLEALDQLQHCPGIFQRRIPKRFDLRLTVVGKRIFPVEIHSQQSQRGRVDFRLELTEDLHSMPHLGHDLPASVGAQVIELTDQLGLSYCAIDMIVTPDGEYVFLEVNPSGQFGWIESLTGLPITLELTSMLRRGHP